MARLYSVARRAIALLRAGIGALVILFFAYMLIAVLVQVVGRYFAFSIDWAAESATLAQIWMVLLAAGLAMRDKLHVRVEAVIETLPEPLLRLLTLVITLACLWFLSLAIRGSVSLIAVGTIEASPVMRLPMWIAYLSLPLGLGYFALELLASLGAVLVGDGPAEERGGPGGGRAMILTGILFLALIVLGAPIVFALGISAAVTIVSLDIPVSIIAQRLFAGLDSFTIMAIPFFVLAGVIMERGGIARRIVDFAVALVGWITGSLLLVACVTGIGMAAVSGSGAASTAAISSTMLGEMRARRYNVDFSAGIIAAAGTLGPVIPPSIMMVVLATTANLSIGRAFLGGIVPGVLMAAGLLLAAFLFAKRGGPAYRETRAFSLGRLARSFVVAIPAFTIPAIVVGGIIGGLFTPTEAAAVAVVVGLLVAVFVYREVSLGDIPQMMLWSASLSAAIMMVIATASVFSWLIASQNVPGAIGAFLHGATDSALLFLLVMGAALLVIGMFMEGISAIMVLAPVLLPIAKSFGVDPLHFGVLMVMNLSLGMLTPPYGITLYVASSVANRSVMQVSRQLGLPLLMLVTVLLLTTLFPVLVTALPDLLIPLPTADGGR